MKKILSLLIVSMFSLSLLAETYTIVFNSGNSDSTSPAKELGAIFLSATNNCVDSIILSEKVYRAKDGFGIKGGTSSAKGELIFRLDDTYHITTMTVYAAPFVNSNGTADNKKIIVCGQELVWDAEPFTEIHPYTFTLNQDFDSISISSSVKSSNRFYVQKIEFEAENPHPEWGIAELQYAKMDFGGVRWTSKDEPMEDVLSFTIVGKNVKGTI
ncbi:MAG: hypothetical protein J5704_00305, partial [Paludibacteraceae bacterium]|nr:hypothetical protein [Paludibacteraceae bacterium]